MASDPQQGDIFWVSIPAHQTEGSEQYGRRPFIVMSRKAVNDSVKTVLVVPMSTKLPGDEPPAHRVLIPASQITKDPSCTSAIVPTSVAKTDQVRVIDKSRLEGRIGRLSQTATIAVGHGLAFVFDIR
jgi:mRNA-degrading endonuclease toxin of MazEF toxin-antitoxin module